MIVIPIEGRAREWRQVRSEIRRILAGCRELRAVEDIHRITIASSAPDGLSAAIVVDADGFVFQAGPLRLDVPTPVQALSLVEQLVAGAVRLRIDQAAGKPITWSLEVRDLAGAWSVLEATGVINWRWWSSRDVVIRQNGVLANGAAHRNAARAASA